MNGRHPVAVDVASHRKERLELRFLAVVNILVAPISYIKNGLVCLNSHNIQAAPSDPKVPHSYATRLVQPVVRVWKGGTVHMASEESSPNIASTHRDWSATQRRL